MVDLEHLETWYKWKEFLNSPFLLRGGKKKKKHIQHDLNMDHFRNARRKGALAECLGARTTPGRANRRHKNRLCPFSNGQQFHVASCPRISVTRSTALCKNTGFNSGIKISLTLPSVEYAIAQAWLVAGARWVGRDCEVCKMLGRKDT